MGNRLLRDGQTANAVFDAANWLLEDEEFTYSYDDNGNLIQKTSKATSEVTDHVYDAENQLTGIQSPAVNAQYRYDGLGRERLLLIRNKIPPLVGILVFKATYYMVFSTAMI